MRQLFKYSVLFAPLCLAATAFSQTEDADVLPPLEISEVETIETDVPLSRLETFLNGITTIKADFRQLAPDGSISTGTFSLERPGRVRFEYDGDKPILIVSDGNIVNFIDYELGQVTRWPVDETPLALLLDDRISFDQNVEVMSIGPAGQPGQTLVTAHDPEKPEQGTLTLIFSGRGGDGAEPLTLQAWEVIDAQGTLTTVSLSNVVTNIDLDKALWTFEDPRNERFQRRRRR